MVDHEGRKKLQGLADETQNLEQRLDRIEALLQQVLSGQRLPAKKWLSSTEAAKALDRSEWTIGQLCRLGLIRGRKHNGRWQLSRETVERLQADGVPPVPRYAPKGMGKVGTLRSAV